MTLTVNGKVSAPDGMELEVIETSTGVEQRRFRVGNGADVSLTVYEPKTLILREVHVASAGALEQKPGEQRHGELEAPDPAKPALVEPAPQLDTALQPGEVVTPAEQLLDYMLNAQDHVFALLAQMISL